MVIKLGTPYYHSVRRCVAVPIPDGKPSKGYHMCEMPSQGDGHIQYQVWLENLTPLPFKFKE